MALLREREGREATLREMTDAATRNAKLAARHEDALRVAERQIFDLKREIEGTLALRHNAEYREEKMKEAKEATAVTLGEAQKRIGDLHDKLRERENAVITLGILLGERKLAESFQTRGR